MPSEMPMYLLAEDEGNEEEILRLLESESPGGSPEDDIPNIASSAGDTTYHSTDEQAPCTSAIGMDGMATLPATNSEYTVNYASRNLVNKASVAGMKSVDESSESLKEKRHGGGWPKGRRRKHSDEIEPPKLPGKGYKLPQLT